MSRLFLICSICGRRQAEGLLSRAAWGHVPTASGEVHACPTCRAADPEWEARLVAGPNGRVGAVVPPSPPRPPIQPTR